MTHRTQAIRFMVILLALSSVYSARAQDHYWQQSVDYQINVSLNDRQHELDGDITFQYTNHSPDTLHFIWFHCWPNAFKTDRTAFSDQLLENGRTDFYFSNKDQRGYINGLEFRVNGRIAQTEDHPAHIDIIKVMLADPLVPGARVEIKTPFHEKIPYNFSRGGHVQQSYQLTQWYPKPAVYDAAGWHPLSYLDQGEFYSEFGSFDVNITLPGQYVVAATGELQNEEEKKWLLQKHVVTKNDSGLKTLHYKQDRVHDFAWFADKQFLVAHDTLTLMSGRVIDAYSFYLPAKNNLWANSISYIKEAVRFYSDELGEYPYQTVSAVETKTGFAGGMEYPTITSISPLKNQTDLHYTILHEIGHNWFYGVLASNERRYTWMDEGMNTFYENRYRSQHPAGSKTGSMSFRPTDEVMLQTLEKARIDQPINTEAADFSETNYYVVPYQKTADWLKMIEDSIGKSVFDRAMRTYFQRWQFRHPDLQDFRSLLENESAKNLDRFFALLDQRGPLHAETVHPSLRLSFVKPAFNDEKHRYIFLAPAVGYNVYDHFMVGALIENYNLPPSHWQFFLAPMYATNSKQLVGLGTINYTWFPNGWFRKIDLGMSGGHFSTLSGIDSNAKSIFGGFYKVAPSIRLTLRNRSPRSQIERYFAFRTFFIGERSFEYSMKSADSLFYPAVTAYSTRYINELSYNIENYRALYPYRALIQLQQSSSFYRVQFTGNYFFNYDSEGGLSIRLFAARFGYLGGPSRAEQFALTNYQPKLTASRGSDDYTYSNYFIGRNETSGLPSQQIMMRDGALKLRTDLFQDLQGRSGNWIAAMNLNTTLPNKLFPVKLPLRLFFDFGTYAEAWGNNPPTSRFLYVGGLQVTLLKNLINIYVPLVYSPDFSNSLKTVPEENGFLKKISFSIDLQQANPRRIFPKLPY